MADLFPSLGLLTFFSGPLACAPNIIHTPHAGWYSDIGCRDLRQSAAREVRRSIVGRFPEDLKACLNKDDLMNAKLKKPSNSTTPSVSSFNPLTAAIPSFGTSIADGQCVFIIESLKIIKFFTILVALRCFIVHYLI